MRPSWDEYFLEIAAVVAKRSTCSRKQVGAVLVRDRQILSTGYGGSIKGQPHCTDAGCEIDPATGGCVRTVHAECNAILQAARNGVSTSSATMYCTLSPCPACFKMLANAGIVRIVYSEEYRIPPKADLATACEIVLLHAPTCHNYSLDVLSTYDGDDGFPGCIDPSTAEKMGAVYSITENKWLLQAHTLEELRQALAKVERESVLVMFGDDKECAIDIDPPTSKGE